MNNDAKSLFTHISCNKRKNGDSPTQLTCLAKKKSWNYGNEASLLTDTSIEYCYTGRYPAEILQVCCIIRGWGGVGLKLLFEHRIQTG